MFAVDCAATGKIRYLRAMCSPRSYTSIRIPLVLAALLLSGCGSCGLGDPNQIFFDAWSPNHKHRRVSKSLPAAGDAPRAEIVPETNPSTMEVEPGDQVDLGVQFRGGPIEQIRVAFGDRYVEIDVDASQASGTSYETNDPAEKALIDVAQAAGEAEGSIYLEGVLRGFLFPSDALEVTYQFQLRGADGQHTPPGPTKTLVLCTQEGDCTPGGTGGGSGGKPAAHCGDGDVCSELTSGDGDAYAAQCQANGQQGGLGACPESYKSGGHSCESATFTSQGQVVQGHFFWRAGYCSKFPHIDTLTTCTDDLDGTPKGQHCTKP